MARAYATLSWACVRTEAVILEKWMMVDMCCTKFA